MKIKTLIADDEYFIRARLVKILSENRDYINIISICEDGKEIIDLLKKEEIDLILTDIKMISVSGLDIAKYIYENNLNTKLIIISGYNDFEYARTAIRYGVTDYLTKPLSIDELLNAVDKCYQSITEKYNLKEGLSKSLLALNHLFNTNNISTNTNFNISNIRSDISKFLDTSNFSALEKYIYTNIKLIINTYDNNSLYRFIREIIASIDIKYHILKDKSIYEYITENILSSNISTSTMLTEVITNICKEYNSLNTYSTKEQILYNNILKEIENNFFNNEFSSKDIALSLNKNQSYLNSVFKKISGLSLSKAINNYRLEKAKFLLKNNSKKITEIALECGFNDMFYFSKKYKEKYGYPPSEEILKNQKNTLF